MKIKIFEDSKTIDLAKLIDTRALICGNSGSGKSYAVRKILEETNNSVMSIVLDLEGEFKSLREKYDFLLIGENGDVSLNPKAAKLLPKKLLELNVSSIIDISELKRPERIRYIKEFLEALMDLGKESWRPCIVVLDEIHQFAGQQEKQDSVYSVIDLATRGRKRGFCLVGCSQRISKLHKDVVAELNNYAIGRTSLDIDMKRASEILGFTSKEQMLSLRELDDGEFFVFGPAIAKNIEKEKIARTETTHYKTGMKFDNKVMPPTPKIKDMLSKLNELPKEAEKEAKDTLSLQKKVHELEKKLLLKEKEVVAVEKVVNVTDEKALQKAKEEGFREAERAYKGQINITESNIKALQRPIQKLITDAGNLLNSKAFNLAGDIPIKEPSQVRVKPTIKSFNRQEVKTLPYATPHQTISTGTEPHALRFGAMEMLGWLAGAYPEGLTKQRLATLCGMSAKGGTFNTYLSDLRRNGYMVVESDKLLITQQGLDVAVVKTIPSGDELITLWKSKLRAGVGKILDLLHTAYPAAVSKSDIGYNVGMEPNGGTFNTYLSDLRRNGLIEVSGQEVKLSGEFFE